MPVYESSTETERATSGMGANLTYGMLQINSNPYYFVIVDDPGASGYDCCGFYKVYYSKNLDQFLEYQVYSKKDKELLTKLYI